MDLDDDDAEDFIIAAGATFLLGYAALWAYNSGALQQIIGSVAGATQGGGNVSVPGSTHLIGPMSVSAFGQAFIKDNEEPGGLPALTRYKDAGKWAIGWGHDYSGTPATISTSQAQAYFDQDMNQVASDINGAVTATLTQNQFDALADLVFNVGIGGISQMLAAINAGNFAQAKSLFSIYNHSQGKVVPSLTARRARDAELFGE
jgi:lysozyme